MEENHGFVVIWTNEDYYTYFRCVIVGLPLVVLEESNVTLTENGNMSGELKVYEAMENNGHIKSVISRCEYHRRGATNLNSPKASYKISLKNEYGEHYECSFLGMRRDDDWILNSLWDDSMLVHNKLCQSIWKSIREDTKYYANEIIDMQYVEVLYNGEYQGVYALMECPDAKQFGIHGKDILYRTNKHEEQIDNNFIEELNELENEQETDAVYMEIKFPKKDRGFLRSWQPAIQWLQYIKNGEQGEIIINRENSIDYMLFIQMVNGNDNVFKNCNICARHVNGKYEIYKIPWDLNMTFGMEIDFNKKKYERVLAYNEKYLDEVDEYFCPDIEQMLKENPLGTSKDIVKRWRVLRSERCTDEAIIQMLEREVNTLKLSGAMKREEDKWKSFSYGANVETMQTYIIKRFAYLDTYFEKWYQLCC